MPKSETPAAVSDQMRPINQIQIYRKIDEPHGKALSVRLNANQFADCHCCHCCHWCPFPWCWWHFQIGDNKLCCERRPQWFLIDDMRAGIRIRLYCFCHSRSTFAPHINLRLALSLSVWVCVCVRKSSNRSIYHRIETLLSPALCGCAFIFTITLLFTQTVREWNVFIQLNTIDFR